ncbi:hypothetical protein EVAR_16571_1 [Eumeta japonica]|uniref:Uncharacterized protein n=1 Tax=Eumeta variegata TaxID=151549 RepID=A0A4C1U3M0_EUMVA|nr:hypothetical protein EVAR_16571_1 [Eumeta japonica]
MVKTISTYVSCQLGTSLGKFRQSHPLGRNECQKQPTNAVSISLCELLAPAVVERQIRGSAVGCMLHVNACCRSRGERLVGQPAWYCGCRETTQGWLLENARDGVTRCAVSARGKHPKGVVSWARGSRSAESDLAHLSNRMYTWCQFLGCPGVPFRER